MCIMEIHEHASAATMTQACAHNLSTVDRDIDMVKKVLTARGQHEAVRTFEHAQQYAHHAYADLLELFGEEAATIVPAEIHSHDHAGNERSLVEVIDSATRQARKDETR